MDRPCVDLLIHLVIYAGTRSPSSSRELQSLAREYPDAVKIIKLTSASEADNAAAVQEIQASVGRIDSVIAKRWSLHQWAVALY